MEASIVAGLKYLVNHSHLGTWKFGRRKRAIPLRAIYTWALVFILNSQLCLAAAEKSPFIHRSEASQLLSRRDFGRHRELSVQLGLRADIADGWEEIFRSKDVDKDLFSSLQASYDLSWTTNDEKRHLANKIIMDSLQQDLSSMVLNRNSFAPLDSLFAGQL